MIEVKRRTVYVVKGKTYLTQLNAYRRAGLLSVLEECAKTCDGAEAYNGRVLQVPSADACCSCEDRPTEQQILARAGELFERDFGARREG